jgi:hypothetical protein
VVCITNFGYVIGSIMKPVAGCGVRRVMSLVNDKR